MNSPAESVVGSAIIRCLGLLNPGAGFPATAIRRFIASTLSILFDRHNETILPASVCEPPPSVMRISAFTFAAACAAAKTASRGVCALTPSNVPTRRPPSMFSSLARSLLRVLRVLLTSTKQRWPSCSERAISSAWSKGCPKKIPSTLGGR